MRQADLLEDYTAADLGIHLVAVHADLEEAVVHTGEVVGRTGPEEVVGRTDPEGVAVHTGHEEVAGRVDLEGRAAHIVRVAVPRIDLVEVGRHTGHVVGVHRTAVGRIAVEEEHHIAAGHTAGAGQHNLQVRPVPAVTFHP